MPDYDFCIETCRKSAAAFLAHEPQILQLLASSRARDKSTALRILQTQCQLRHRDCLFEFCQTEPEQKFRLEACELFRRLRDESIIPLMLQLLADPNPLIVGQACLALAPYKTQTRVARAFRKLRQHPNEIVRELLDNLLSPPGRLACPPAAPALHDVLVTGDVNKILRHVPPGVFDLTFTSPPYYNARDYSIFPSYQHYLDFLKTTFAQVHTATKEGRFLIVNTSPVIMPRVDRQYQSRRYPIPFDLHPILTDLDWEFIDDIIWCKPESSVKNRNGGFFQHRNPLAYKPNTCSEYVMVYRKKCSKLIDWNLKQYSPEIRAASRVTGDYPRSNLWEIMPTATRQHSAVFPRTLAENVIKLYSMHGDLIFDPFAGSGTTAVVARELGRRFFVTEIAPAYAAVIAANLQKTTAPFTQLTAAQFARRGAG